MYYHISLLILYVLYIEIDLRVKSKLIEWKEVCLDVGSFCIEIKRTSLALTYLRYIVYMVMVYRIKC